MLSHLDKSEWILCIIHLVGNKNSVDLILATYLFLLGLGLLCISLLCLCLKPDLVVAMETVESQHRQDLMAFTKKERERERERALDKTKQKAKPIHFTIR